MQDLTPLSVRAASRPTERPQATLPAFSTHGVCRGIPERNSNFVMALRRSSGPDLAHAFFATAVMSNGSPHSSRCCAEFGRGNSTSKSNDLNKLQTSATIHRQPHKCVGQNVVFGFNSIQFFLSITSRYGKIMADSVSARLAASTAWAGEAQKPYPQPGKQASRPRQRRLMREGPVCAAVGLAFSPRQSPGRGRHWSRTSSLAARPAHRPERRRDRRSR